MQIYDGRENFYQWDLNQKITSDAFKVGDEIHFTNLKQSIALIVLAYELDGKIVVDVPNILLQSSHPITVYRYIRATDVSCTIEEYQFKVNQRSKPSDYVYTETEIKAYETLEKRIEKLEKTGCGESDAPDLTNYIRMWQSNTEYKVGDIVLYEYPSNSGDNENPASVLFIYKCKQNHTSSNMRQDHSDKCYWDRFDITVSGSTKDGLGRYIVSTYATKEEVGNIETALDNIIALQNSLIGGDA